MKYNVAPGCTFESEEDMVINPILGTKSGCMVKEPTLFRRKSELDDIPDNYVERMRANRSSVVNIPIREPKMPEGFAVAIAFNKGGYMVIPKEDLKNA
mgnify:CR=1 FL=1|tara:strand:+ start:228 stop:521 length:294 start_codon:yes stop_codon:yes gene_type:complete